MIQLTERIGLLTNARRLFPDTFWNRALANHLKPSDYSLSHEISFYPLTPVL
jgi:hypothetical protein